VVLVTDGFTVAYPPEVYVEEDAAESEAERWAWLLARDMRRGIERPFEGRWEIGDYWVRMLRVELVDDETGELWIGTHWTRDGFPDPEAEMFAEEAEARTWVMTPGSARVRTGSHETPWSVGAVHMFRGEEEYSEAHRAKVVR
jgi:hypothetical protein